MNSSPLFLDPFRWQIGTRSLAADHWLQFDDARPSDLAEKAALIEAIPDEVLAWTQGSENAGAEVEQLVTADLAYQGLAMEGFGDHPIERAGRSVQEDLCLLECQRGEWLLTAGCVCFPTQWTLSEKMGESLAAIHDPVPGYHREIGVRVERFFDALTPGAIVSRLNWSLVDDRSRRLSPGAGYGAPVVPVDIGRDLFVRVERQTLRRLKGHPAIVFGIRIHVWSLAEVIATIKPERLAATLETMPDDIAEYKNLDGLKPALFEWLAGQ